MISRNSAPLSHSPRRKVSSPVKTVGTFAPKFIKLATEHTQSDAAVDAEFGDKKWVWVKDARAGFLRAWVLKEEGEDLHVRCTDDTDKVVKKDETDKVNPPKFDGIQDMASLTYLNEPSVAYNLQQRHCSESVYTYSGLFLVAVNPYRSLPIYGKDTIESIRHRAQDEPNQPHVFATADTAYHNMLELRENQSILVTGESGAGKTENTKKVIQYLAAIASVDRSLDQGISLEQQIIRANPLLEAFGNAQTVRNDNSSRFGKFIRIHFSDEGHITGANINWFLLEKSRVATQSSQERNYHIFYQLLAGASKKLREDLLLSGGPQDYEYLKHSRLAINGISDKRMFDELLNSFKVMNFTDSEQLNFFRAISAILHIGNLEIAADRADQARLVDISQAERLCFLLGVNTQDFVKALLTPRVKAGKEWVTNARSATQVKASLAALARNLYERNFGALVDRINQTTTGASATSSHFIGVLDMAGFEIFETNSFEQLCINYTNEKLQQFFNHHMFVLEQEEYAREQIDWKFVDFGLDLQPTIELIEKSNPIGLLSCLDEECVMPKATDITFTEKLHQLWSGQSKKYRTSKFPKDGFVLTHYAADVEYKTHGWLEKNKDPLNDNITQLLAASSTAYIKDLYYDGLEDGTRQKKGLFRTVAQRHKEQLAALMTQLHSTQPHFIRCIIPNHVKSPKTFDFALVLDQLRCNGVLEGIRIARTGFPNRLPFSDFRQRYSILAASMPKGYLDGAKAAEIILRSIDLDRSYYRIGLSKVFFRAGVLAELEEKREALFRALVITVQSTARAYMVRRLIRKRLHRKEATVLLQGDFKSFLELQQSPWWQLFMKMKPILSATKSDREMKMRSAEIQKLEALAAQREQAAQKALEEMRRIESTKQELLQTLEAERLTSQDKEVLYERSREREILLQEELDAAQGDIDTLEGRCDDLLGVKRDLEGQIAKLRDEVDSTSTITQRLLVDKESLILQLSDLDAKHQGNLEHESKLQQLKTEHEQEVRQLQSALTTNSTELNKLRTVYAKFQEEARSKTEASALELEQMKRKLNTLLLEKKAAQSQLDETIDAASASEGLLRQKTAEISSIQQTLASKVASLTDSAAQVGQLGITIEDLKSQVAALTVKLAAAESSHSNALLELQKSKQTAPADSGSELEEVKAKLLQATTEHDQKHLQYRKDTENRTREAETYRMAVQKLEVINGDLVKQMAKAMQDLNTVRSDVLESKSKIREILGERDTLQQRLAQAENASDSADGDRAELNRQLKAAYEQVRSITAKVSQVDVEKERFRREAMDMRAKFDELRLQRSDSTGTCRKVESELQAAKRLHTQLLAEHQVVKDELHKNKLRLDHVNKLDKDLVATQVRDISIQKDQLTAQLQESRETTRKVEQELSALQLSKARFSKELGDLAHELEKEHQISRASEKLVSQLQAQLAETREHLEAESKQKATAQSHFRQLQRSLEEATEELTTRTEQVMLLNQAIYNDDSRPGLDWNMQKSAVSKNVDLAKELQTAKQAQKRAEAGRLILERQVEEIRRNSQENNDFNAKHLALRSRTDAVPSKEVLRPGTPTRPVTAPWTPPAIMRSGLFEPGRSRTNTIAQNFENRGSITPSDSQRAESMLNKKVHQLEEEVELLQQKLQKTPANRHNDVRVDSDSEATLTISRLTRENARLHELLDDNADQLDAMETAQRQDREFLKDMQSKSMSEIESAFRKLADDRIKLVRNHKKSVAELEKSSQERDNLRLSKVNLQKNLQELQLNLEEQIGSGVEQAAIITQLEDELTDVQASAEMATVRAQEMEDSVKMYRNRAEEYFDRLENAESTVAKATQAEQWAKKQWQEAEDALAQLTQDRQSQDNFISKIQRQVQDLENRLEDSQLELSQFQTQRSRLSHELEQYRSSKTQERDEQDLAAEQTRKAYQRELTALSSELEVERSTMVQMRNDYTQMRAQYEELQLKWNDDNLIATTLEKESIRKENKIQDLVKELQRTDASQREAQSRVVTMLSELRELRSAKEDIEISRDELMTEKRGLESRVRVLEQSLQDTSQASHARLPSSPPRPSPELVEKEELIQLMHEKLVRAETIANTSHSEILQERASNVRLHKEKVNLEKEKKELQLRLIDFETKSLKTSHKDVAFLQKRVSELEKELNQHDSSRMAESKQVRNTDRTIKDLEATLSHKESMNKRLEDKLSKVDSRHAAAIQELEAVRDSEAQSQLRARKAERDAADQRERALRAEKELERFRSREETSKMSRSNTLNTLNGMSIRTSPSLSSLSMRSLNQLHKQS